MPDRDDNSLQFDTADAGIDPSKYLIYSRLEIASILSTLYTAGTLITAYIDGGNDFILTSVAGVNTERNLLFFDFGADDDANRRALAARKITFVTVHERIRIQFVAHSLRSARLEDRAVFALAIPDSLLRLQRREYFRIDTPLVKPLKCIIPPQRGRYRAPPEVTIVDISCGGISLIDAAEPALVETGAVFRDCRIALPELGEVKTGIAIRSTYDVSHRSGAVHRRAGCEFVGMSERDRALIQRYINRLERERSNRSAARRSPPRG